MSQPEQPDTLAREMLRLAEQCGVDLAPLYRHTVSAGAHTQAWFGTDGRFIHLSRADGLVKYYLQGRVTVLPEVFKESASAFRGAYGETGWFRDVGQAVKFLKSWLLEAKEVDGLPLRCLRSFNII